MRPQSINSIAVQVEQHCAAPSTGQSRIQDWIVKDKSWDGKQEIITAVYIRWKATSCVDGKDQLHTLGVLQTPSELLQQLTLHQQLTSDASVRLWIDKSITAQTAGQQLGPIRHSARAQYSPVRNALRSLPLLYCELCGFHTVRRRRLHTGCFVLRMSVSTVAGVVLWIVHKFREIIASLPMGFQSVYILKQIVGLMKYTGWCLFWVFPSPLHYPHAHTSPINSSLNPVPTPWKLLWKSTCH